MVSDLTVLVGIVVIGIAVDEIMMNARWLKELELAVTHPKQFQAYKKLEHENSLINKILRFFNGIKIEE